MLKRLPRGCGSSWRVSRRASTRAYSSKRPCRVARFVLAGYGRGVPRRQPTTYAVISTHSHPFGVPGSGQAPEKSERDRFCQRFGFQISRDLLRKTASERCAISRQSRPVRRLEERKISWPGYCLAARSGDPSLRSGCRRGMGGEAIGFPAAVAPLSGMNTRNDSQVGDCLISAQPAKAV